MVPESKEMYTHTRIHTGKKKRRKQKEKKIKRIKAYEKVIGGNLKELPIAKAKAT